MEDRKVHQQEIYKMVQPKKTARLSVRKCRENNKSNETGWTCPDVQLNAEGRRISESRMRENRTYGLMRGRWVAPLLYSVKGEEVSV